MTELLFNPNTYDPQHLDGESRRLLRATIDWFEARGKQQLIADDLSGVWYTEFLDFVRREKLFATFQTPAKEAAGNSSKRWDAARNAALSEVLGFYGLQYWYAWQVTILGLGPIWMNANAAARQRAAQLLDDGAVFASALSEKGHGADVYSTDMVLAPDDSTATVAFRATGDKYYIGNGNVAGMVSVFGRRADIDGAAGYVFFAVDSQHPRFHLLKNVVASQMFVSAFRLDDYPVREEDILHAGSEAFSAALNTVNVGKFNLCTGSIGICEHALYEAITHAHERILYGHPVTDFPHVRVGFVDAYARLVAMKLFSDRAVDYFRTAGPEDRRYLLFNPITKMKVTTEGEKAIDLLWDIIAAKGFEKDTYFRMATRDIRALPKLEGTVQVNLALVLKFMPNYLFRPQDYPPVPQRHDAADDEFLFRQPAARGLGSVAFHDWRPAYQQFAAVPNVARFTEQAEGLVAFLTECAPEGEQAADLDFLLNLGHLFTLVVYGQLILEQAALIELEPTVIDQILTSWSATSPATPWRCTARRPRLTRSRPGRWRTFANPSPTRPAWSSCGGGSKRFRVPTRCVPETLHPTTDPVRSRHDR